MDYRRELEKIRQSADYNRDISVESEEIVLYGAGALGEMAMDILRTVEMRPSFVVDKKARGQLKGMRISSLSNLPDRVKKEALFLVTICTVSYNEIQSELTSIGIRHIVPFYNYAFLVCPEKISNGWFIHNISPKIEEEVFEICKLLEHDECSLHHYLQFCWWKLRGREVQYANYPVLSGRKYFRAPCMPELGENETLVDCGCHRGDTIRAFIDEVNGCFKRVIAFEPDEDNLIYAQRLIDDRRVIFDSRAVSLRTEKRAFMANLGFASKIMQGGKEIVETTNIDDLNICPSIIKIHVEGEEYNAMRGAAHTLRRNRPILMVFADHNEDGLYKIPSYIQNLKNYVLYFNLHDYCGNSAVFYMIPEERVKEK